MSATAARLPLVTAQRLAARLAARLEPSCARLAVAGSIRRQQPDVGDVELVCIPRLEVQDQRDLFGSVVSQETVSRLDCSLDELLRLEHIVRTMPDGWSSQPAWGSKLKRFWLWANDRLGWVMVDLHVTTPDHWGWKLALATGPGDFNRALVTYLYRNTPYRQQAGALVRQATGEAVPVPDEAAYFRLAGLPWIPPRERTLARFWQVVREVRMNQRKRVPRTESPPVPSPAGPPPTTVVNIRRARGQRPAYDVYIGRANARAGLSASKWANPFTVSKCGSHQAAVDAYAEWIQQPAQAHLLRAIPELVAQRLGCWCKPAPCHGDVLAQYANAYAAGTWAPPVRRCVPDEKVHTWIRARLQSVMDE
jgi:hypothetical protein